MYFIFEFDRLIYRMAGTEERLYRWRVLKMSRPKSNRSAQFWKLKRLRKTFYAKRFGKQFRSRRIIRNTNSYDERIRLGVNHRTRAPYGHLRPPNSPPSHRPRPENGDGVWVNVSGVKNGRISDETGRWSADRALRFPLSGVGNRQRRYPTSGYRTIRDRDYIL